MSPHFRIGPAQEYIRLRISVDRLVTTLLLFFIRFTLDGFDNHPMLMEAIGTIYYAGGTTNTAAALMLFEDIFTKFDGSDDKDGDRSSKTDIKLFI